MFNFPRGCGTRLFLVEGEAEVGEPGSELGGEPESGGQSGEGPS